MTETGVWTTRGFESFRRGTFGNAGHNLYVSRAGVLQRIHQFDLNGNGYFDLVFCNDHPHHEQPPTYVYTDPLGTRTLQEVPSDGARTGAVADLNGNGYDDLVMGMFHNGERFDLNAFVYYGSVDGFTERRHQRLPAPHCLSVAAGDFNGDGRPDLAFICHRSYEPLKRLLTGPIVRVFYQTELGLEASRFVDLEIAGHELAAADLDEDGYDDLIVRAADGSVGVRFGPALAAWRRAAAPCCRQAVAPRFRLAKRVYGPLEPRAWRAGSRPTPRIPNPWSRSLPSTGCRTSSSRTTRWRIWSRRTDGNLGRRSCWSARGP